MLAETIIATIPATIAALASIDARRTTKLTHRKVTLIDEAVNQVPAHENSISDNVAKLVRAQEASPDPEPPPDVLRPPVP